MSKELKPVRCGCGGKAEVGFTTSGLVYVECCQCLTETRFFHTEAEAITAWNKAMGVTDINVSHKIIEFLRCNKCNRIVDSGYKYCPECGCKLEFE
jgi:hypothetical protein